MVMNSVLPPFLQRPLGLFLSATVYSISLLGKKTPRVYNVTNIIHRPPIRVAGHMRVLQPCIAVSIPVYLVSMGFDTGSAGLFAVFPRLNSTGTGLY